MRILLVYIHFEVCGGRYYADAFKRRGIDVRHIGQQASVNDAWGLRNPISTTYAHKPDGDFNAYWPDWEPDLILVADSMTAMAGYKHPHYDAPHAVIAIDNHVRNYDAPHWAHQFLAHYHSPTYPVDPARKDQSWLPCAADSEMFTPSPIPWDEREYDVACVGVMYPRRAEVVQALRDAGLKVLAETGLVYKEYRDAYQNSRISLCVSAAGDVAQRIFETGRMGCAVLSDPLLDLNDAETNRSLGLRGFAIFTNPAEAVMIAKDMLATSAGHFVVNAAVDNRLSAGVTSALSMAQTCWPHTWESRVDVIVRWYERAYEKVQQTVETPQVVGVSPTGDLVKADDPIPDGMIQRGQIEVEPTPTIAGVFPDDKPWLNLGCGTTHFPSARPPGHELVDEALYRYPLWLNVDKVEGVGADRVFDLFSYPWPLEDNSFDGAVLGHIVEHIPHEITLSDLRWMYPMDHGMGYTPKAKKLAALQDGWYAFFSELYRVLTPGAFAHIISPYGWSDGAITDPTHTRLLTINTFHHGLSPSQYSGTFKYNIACNFAVDFDQLRYSPLAQAFIHDHDLLMNATMTRINMVYDFYVRLKAIK